MSINSTNDFRLQIDEAEALINKKFKLACEKSP